MKLKFTIGEIAKVTGGELLCGDASLPISSLSIDSRKVASGELFLPIIGENYDGHQFLVQARESGATACLCQSSKQELAQGFTAVVLVKDTLLALQAIAAAHRRLFTLPVVCLTGSCGKTMVKEMCAAILAKQYRVYASHGNMNNEVGLPQQVLELLPEHEVAVLELGTNHPGELAVLCGIALPQTGIWTNVGMGHIGHFNSVEAIAEEKSALVRAIPRDGLMIINADDERVLATASLCQGRVVTYGLNGKANYTATDLQSAENGISMVVDGLTINLSLVGRHSASNALAALALGREWGVPLPVVAEALSTVRPLGRRLAVERIGGITLLDDCYNANPNSMRAAFEALIAMPGRRKLAVLSDMLELGTFGPEQHRLVGESAARLGVEGLYVTGEFVAEYINGALSGGLSISSIHQHETLESLKKDLISEIQAGDIILIKASRGAQLETISEALKQAFTQKGDA